MTFPEVLQPSTYEPFCVVHKITSDGKEVFRGVSSGTTCMFGIISRNVDIILVRESGSILTLSSKCSSIPINRSPALIQSDHFSRD